MPQVRQAVSTYAVHPDQYSELDRWSPTYVVSMDQCFKVRKVVLNTCGFNFNETAENLMKI